MFSDMLLVNVRSTIDTFKTDISEKMAIKKTLLIEFALKQNSYPPKKGSYS